MKETNKYLQYALAVDRAVATRHMVRMKCETSLPAAASPDSVSCVRSVHCPYLPQLDLYQLPGGGWWQAAGIIIIRPGFGNQYSERTVPQS